MTPDPYRILGVAPSASLQEIRTAYLAGARKFHPDLYLSYAQKIWATRKMQDLNVAYASILKGGRRSAEIKRTPTTPRNDATTKVPAQETDLHDDRRWNIGFGIAWAIFSVLFFLFITYQNQPEGVSGWIISGVLSVFVSPLIMIALAVALAMPIAAIVFPFLQSFSDKRLVT